MHTKNKIRLLEDAIQVLNCPEREKIGQLLAITPLNSLLKLFQFGEEMTKIVNVMSKIRSTWGEFTNICECILERHYSDIKSLEVEIGNTKDHSAVQIALESIFGKEITINFTINTNIQWGFMIYIRHLGMLCEYTNHSLKRALLTEINSMGAQNG